MKRTYTPEQAAANHARKKKYYLANKEKINARNKRNHAAKAKERAALKATQPRRTDFCRACGVKKTGANTGVDKTTLNGFSARCKACHRIWCRDRYEARQPEAIKEANRALQRAKAADGRDARRKRFEAVKRLYHATKGKPREEPVGPVSVLQRRLQNRL